MPGITKKLHVVGTIPRTGEAIFEKHDACDACGCLVFPERKNSKETGRMKCSGKCGYVSDAIPASDLGIS